MEFMTHPWITLCNPKMMKAKMTHDENTESLYQTAIKMKMSYYDDEILKMATAMK